MVLPKVHFSSLLILLQFIFALASQITFPEPRASSSLAFCEQTFSTEKFSIILAKKTNPQPFECRFHVSAFSPDVCRLRVNFRKFALDSAPSCRNEFLRIGGRRLCGSIFGVQLFPFSDASSVINYRGDGENALEIDVEQVRCKVQALPRGCDVTSSDSQTEISSPNYPDSYPSPLTCLYTIQTHVPDVCQLLIRFLDFDIPDSHDCLSGRLLIDGKAYCGKKTGWQVSVNISEEFRFEFSAGSGQSTGAFRVSVDQVPCLGRQDIPFNTSANQLEYLPPSPYPSQCCNRVFSSSSFILTSPGFLDLTAPSEFTCVYQISQVSPTACRLRLNFLYFWLGQEDVYYGCTDGFIEIDGRRVCGCKDGITIDSYFNGGTKELLFNMRGPRSKGFVIEVTQEECGGFRGRSIPEEVTKSPDNEVEVFATNTTVEKVRSRFFVPSDDSRCYQWGLPHWLDKVRGILQSVSGQCPAPSQSTPPFPTNPIQPPSSPLKPLPPLFHPPNCSPPVLPPPQYPIRPVPPIFPPPQYPIRPVPPVLPPPVFPLPPPQYPIRPVPPVLPPPIIPPPQYPIRPVPPILPPPILPPPQYPIRPVPPILPPPVLPPPQYPIRPVPPIFPPPILPPGQLPNPPIFPPYPPQPLPPNFPPGRCQVFSSLQGGFQSPGYPWSYPPGQKCCYRIRQAAGFCQVQLSILDFDVCWSLKCYKDYLLLDQNARFCGRALQSSAVYLPFRSGFASVDFISDNLQSSRGFRAVYRQIPCYSTPLTARSDNDSNITSIKHAKQAKQ